MASRVHCERRDPQNHRLSMPRADALRGFSSYRQMHVVAFHALQASCQHTCKRGAGRAVKQCLRRLEGGQSEVYVYAVTLTRPNAFSKAKRCLSLSATTSSRSAYESANPSRPSASSSAVTLT